MKIKPKHGTGAQKRQGLPDDPEQSKRFEEKARELGIDIGGFDNALESIVPPSKRSKPPPTASDT